MSADTTEAVYEPIIFDLPNDILSEIAAFADRSTTWSLSRTCKHAAEIIIQSAENSPCDLAAHDGHLEILDWAINAGNIPTEKTCVAAASRGYLHILKYLHVMVKCPWDDQTTAAAAAGGHLDTMIYALDNGCLWLPYMFNEAAKNGHLCILIYAYNTKIPECTWYTPNAECSLSFWDVSNGDIILDYAIKHDHIHVIEWIAPHRRMYESMMNRAIKCGSIKVIEFLVAKGMPLTFDWWALAILHEQTPVLDWLYNHGCPGRQDVREHAEIHDKQRALAWVDSKGL